MEDPLGGDQETRSFLMQSEPTGRIFYECEGCGMCGCPSFDYYPGGLPQEIQDHLMWHAQWCKDSER